MIIYSTDLWKWAMRESALLHLRLEKYPVGFLGITEAINYGGDEAAVYWKLESPCSLF